MPIDVPSTRKVTLVMVTFIPATGVAVSVTVRFRFSPGEARVMDDGVVEVVVPVPLVPVVVVFIPPPQAVNTVAQIPTVSSVIQA
jgi:hypothetical protein